MSSSFVEEALKPAAAKQSTQGRFAKPKNHSRRDKP
jgi:hypothetical protein